MFIYNFYGGSLMQNIQQISLSEINDAEEGFNSRGEKVRPLDVVDLAKDIEINGLLQPVVIAPYEEHDALRMGKKYRLILGYRRFAAYHLVLNKDTIPAVVKDHPIDEKRARLMNLSENLKRKNLNILQEAKAVEQLYKLGLSVDNVGKQLGMSYGWTQIRHMLMCLPVDIQQEAAIGVINQTQIRKLFTIQKDSGVDMMYNAVKTIKTAKARGEKVVNLDDKFVSPQTQRKTRTHRTRLQIFDMMNHIQETIGNGLFTRCMAWAAGEVNDDELFDDLKDYAMEHDMTYSKPIIGD